MRAYCTIFDKNYLYQGVALYNSLKRHAGDFKLYTLCMDPISYSMMQKMESDDLIPINVDKLITPEVSAVRERTSHGQFCWVCQPLLCQFILETYDDEMITYLEADSLFFSDPEVLFTELGDKSVSLVSHNFPPNYDYSAKAGRFCVQFNAFRRNDVAQEILEYWKLHCFKYVKEKPYIVPGQTCLNDWPERFSGVKIIEHHGAGVAPWNIQQFKFEERDSVPYVDGVPIVFYHYHQYGMLENGSHQLGDFPLSRHIIDTIYKTYVREIAEAERMVRSLDPTFSYRRTYKNSKTFIEAIKSLNMKDVYEYIKILRKKVRGRYNVLPDKYFFSDL